MAPQGRASTRIFWVYNHFNWLFCALSGDEQKRLPVSVVVKIPKLGKEAAAKAIKKWGQPKSKITHPISSSAPAPASTCPAPTTSSPSSSASSPRSTGLLHRGHRPPPGQGSCREQRRCARFLVVYSEITAVTFRGPFDTYLDSLVGQAHFSDGAVAVTKGKQISGEIEPEMANTESKFLKHEVIYITHLLQN
ncbi:hypothetical protein RJ639_044124 [Escallonia herrerae]|uniref:chalcone synthase n=1 Tax=Escallonia herrerae TaxID=1293975 RepID=A0AA88WBW0_9ASTE|nr:hypothetical protein RJ639_044124 [Escallonia herrerae]